MKGNLDSSEGLMLNENATRDWAGDDIQKKTVFKRGRIDVISQ